MTHKNAPGTLTIVLITTPCTDVASWHAALSTLLTGDTNVQALVVVAAVSTEGSDAAVDLANRFVGNTRGPTRAPPSAVAGETGVSVHYGRARQPRPHGDRGPHACGRVQQPARTVTTHATFRHDQTDIEPLSAREHEVLEVLAQGASNQEIAHALVIAPNTVKRHVQTILAKLGVHNRTQAVARAQHYDLLAHQHGEPTER